jgi:uncharacterized protein (TIGR02145 family)
MSEADAASEGWRGSPVGDYMKSTSGWSDWSGSSGNGSNSSGFTGLPGGYRYAGDFGGNGYYGNWWSASESGSNSWGFIMGYDTDDVNRYSQDRSVGYFARCVRD